ncbi:hypothetical protein vBVpP1_65 [Vibrio phage vB_VpP_1]|nr:hypothetical protein vBVpP1_65 [Vibrio phage vB_VpP_1]
MAITVETVQKVTVKSIQIEIPKDTVVGLKPISNEGMTVYDALAQIPSFIGQHSKESIYLDIDLETGKILNWQTPTGEQLQSIIEIE